MSEEQLILLLKRGDASALTHVVQLYGDRLKRAAAWLTGCTEEADDILQETYSRILPSILRFQGNSSLFTWLYSILIHISRHRRRQRRFFLFPGELPEIGIPAEAEAEYRRKQISQRIGETLDRLSRRHREVLILRYFEGMKIGEISRALGISEGTVKSRLHFAAIAVRKKIPTDLFIPEAATTQQEASHAMQAMESKIV